MRPRVFPAEDAGLQHRSVGMGWASMRPRVFPAEDSDAATDGFVLTALQ